MRHLLSEFSCENLLAYVEMTQFIQAWKPDNFSKYDPLIWGFSRMMANEYAVEMPDDVVCMIIYYYKMLYADFGYGREEISTIAFRRATMDLYEDKDEEKDDEFVIED